MDSFLTIFYHGRDLAVVFSLYFITDEIWQCQISSEISDDIGQLYSNITDRSHGASYMGGGEEGGSEGGLVKDHTFTLFFVTFPNIQILYMIFSISI